jgi:hypothetical protein
LSRRIDDYIDALAIGASSLTSPELAGHAKSFLAILTAKFDWHQIPRSSLQSPIVDQGFALYFSELLLAAWVIQILSREAFQAKAYIRRTLQNVGKKLSPKMNIGYPVRFCLRAYPTTSEPMALNAGILSFGKSTLG